MRKSIPAGIIAAGLAACAATAIAPSASAATTSKTLTCKVGQTVYVDGVWRPSGTAYSPAGSFEPGVYNSTKKPTSSSKTCAWIVALKVAGVSSPAFMAYKVIKGGSTATLQLVHAGKPTTGLNLTIKGR